MTLLTVAIGPRTAEAAAKLAHALQHLSVIDPAIEVRAGGADDEVVIGGMSEMQLENVIDRLRRDFAVEASIGRPQVAYMETVTRAAEGESQYKGESGAREYAHVKVRVYPSPAASQPILEDRIIGGTIPTEFMPAVEQGIHEGLSRGIIDGYPVRDARVELYDGSYHDLDSTAGAFKIAGFRALREALFMAECVLLEPLMRVSISIPPECVDDILQDLAQRRARIHSHGSRGETHHILAIAPLAELFGHQSYVRASTGGRGVCDVEFAAYAPMQPSDNEPGDPDSLVTAPRKPAPPLRQTTIALPEPDDDASGA